jgi:tetratricopeptide (TPR) repeat protein
VTDDREPGILAFLDFVLDAANARLRRGAEIIPLRPKALALLSRLAARPGRLVTKDELLEAVWPDTAVSDWVLTSTVKELREALGDDAREPRIIETVHRRGYRFLPAVDSGPPSGGILLASRVVGRGAELAALADRWHRAMSGERQIVFVIGEAGIGKTTLVDEFLESLDGSTCLVARGQCIEQGGAGEPYLPVVEALGRLCAEADGKRVVDVLRRHAPAWLVQLPGLLDAAECEALERRLGASTRDRMLREMATLVAALPAPLVLVLEDLHWSDQPTLDLVSTLARRRDAARLLLIGTYRPVEVAVRNHPLRGVHEELRSHERCHDLWLPPLTEAATAEYLRTRWPGLHDVERLARLGHERTDGNPLFLVNLADYFEATGAVALAADGWAVQRDPAMLGDDVPPGLRQLLAVQIERLDDTERAALEAGSVAGRSFSAALVAAVLEADVVAVEGCFASLADGGIMVCADGTSTWPDGTVAGAYRFNHFVHQSVFRDHVPPARRRQLHERIATRLEQAHAGNTTDVSTELAFHFEAAGHAERAVPYLEEAAGRALSRGANEEAATLLQRGLDILDPLPRTPERTLRTIRLCLTFGSSLEPTRGYGNPQIERVYEHARRLSEESADPVQLFQVLVAVTATYVGQARLDRAQETARGLRQLSGEMPLPPFVFTASLFSGLVDYRVGHLSEARELLERARSLGDVPLPALSVDLHEFVLGTLALVLLHQGHLDEARTRLREAETRAAAGDRPFDRSFAAQQACIFHLISRDTDALASAAEQALASEGFPTAAAIGRVSRGRVLSAKGDHRRGVAVMREAIDAYRATGQRITLPVMLAALAEGHAAAGDETAARACVAEARAVAESTGDVHYLAELHRLEGTLDPPAAERSFRRAVEVAREQGARWWELRATSSLARLATGGSVADDLAQLVAWFEGTESPDLRDARQVLAELRGHRA